MIAKSAVWSAKPSEGLHPRWESIDRSRSMHDAGDDPFGGMSRPATVIDARRVRAMIPLPRPSVVRPSKTFDYGTAIATIVAVSRFRTPSLPSPYKEIA
jgi:hypothetical protein